MTTTLRLVKGTALTHTEGDNNIIYLDKKLTLATIAPTVDDDELIGFTANKSLWLDVLTGLIYKVTDVTAGSAVWSSIPSNPYTDFEIKVKYENNADTNAYTDAEKTKLGALESSRYKGSFVSLLALETAFPTAELGDYADVDTGVGADTERYIWDNDDVVWVLQLGSSTSLTDVQIKTQYENNADTNAFTDAFMTLLQNFNGISQLVQLDGSGDLPALDGSALTNLVTTFLGNTDTPASYTANQWLRVNSAGDAIEEVAPPVQSITTETGTDAILNLVSLTQPEYDALTPVATTLYVITE